MIRRPPRSPLFPSPTLSRSFPYPSVRPREPLAVPLLGEEPLGEVEPLLGFRHSALELIELGEQPLRVATKNDAALGGLHGHPLLVGLRPPADPLRERLAHPPRPDQRGADHQGQANHADGRCPLSHATVPSLEVNLPS